MSRFLFHSLPLAGHLYPIAAVAQELTRRGHDVAWAGVETVLRPLLGEQARIYPTGLPLYRGELRDRGMTATKSRWKGYIVPHTRFTLPAVQRAVEEFAPDAMAVDQHAVAGALAAHRAGVRWATLAPTSMEIARPYAGLPKVEAWIRGLLGSLWTGAGLPGEPPHDLRFSPYTVIAFSGAALAGADVAREVALVGPALAERPSDADFPWEWLDPDRQRLLVTAGTLALGTADGFHARVLAAVAPLRDRLQVVLLAPDQPEAASDSPDVLVRPRVPMLRLMPHLHAVVTHGGLNTVCEALAHGVPLVIAPITSDQPINADQVVAAGAGVRVRFDRATPAQLRAALLTVLDDPACRDAAGRVQESFRQAGGAAAAADHLAALAGAEC
ncbi:glycosyltransferase [Catellatospora sp. KI3]|uniref:glycosyltransferase n=1 Tax=Catellatospora sp. KI3 TaxID=3041620 RepID=UPI002482482B|nr:nucleotide disphospho-sugar-binding domain-containing protein [Catellatospora sp. KI3]MDI1463584.1 glycosyltransferase [Catellatospora sp. KI3]